MDGRWQYFKNKNKYDTFLVVFKPLCFWIFGSSIYCLNSGHSWFIADVMNSTTQFSSSTEMRLTCFWMREDPKIWRGANDNNDIKKDRFERSSWCSFPPNKCDNLTKDEEVLLFPGFYASNDLVGIHAQAVIPICMASTLLTRHHRKFWPFLG